MPKPYFENTKKIPEILMVNHAGEFGAQRIYQGQIKYTKHLKDKKILKTMLDQEAEHLEYFSDKLLENQSRPTALIPIWNFLGFFIGAISAKSGIKTAMLVTEAVEDVIQLHYDEQISYLESYHPNSQLLEKIKKFKSDEIEHQNVAIKNGSQEVASGKYLSLLVKKACKFAIFLSKKI